MAILAHCCLIEPWHIRKIFEGSKIRELRNRMKKKIIISQEFCFSHFYHFFIDGRYKSMVRMSKMKFTHSVWHTLSPHSKTIDAILDLSSSAAAAVMDIDNGRTLTHKFIIFLFDAVIISLKMVVRVTFIFIRSTLPGRAKAAA